MITNPEYLPKDRLKQELKKHGVSCNPNENKDYYVQLYREQVMHGKEPEKLKSEFSSDEEFVRQSPRVSKKQQKSTPAKSKKAPKIDTILPQVETLTDKQLSERLQGYGENVGPITSTTRSVYERKLAKLVATEGGSLLPDANSHDRNESFVKEWSSEEESEEEDVDTAPPPQRRVETRSKTKKQYIKETVHVASPLMSKGAVEEPEVRRRPKPPSSSKSGKRPHLASPSSSRSSSCSNIWSLVCSVLLIVLMFAIAFLLYEHYTCAEDQDSLVITGWKKAGELVVQMRGVLLKEPPIDAATKNAEQPGSGAEPPKGKKQKKGSKKSKSSQ